MTWIDNVTGHELLQAVDSCGHTSLFAKETDLAALFGNHINQRVMWAEECQRVKQFIFHPYARLCLSHFEESAVTPDKIKCLHVGGI
jgi:hypothetical protein